MVEREWAVVSQFLPPGWRELAKAKGALVRARGVGDPETLLRLLLMHVAGGLGLQQTVARAAQQGLATISAVALHKRLQASEPWLRALTLQMLAHTRYRPELAARWKTRRVRVVDATDITEAGARGATWRVHYSLRLPTLDCDSFEVTGAEVGETFRRFDVKPGDIILGDRGYCHARGIASVLAARADVVVRLTSTALRLFKARGSERFDLFAALRSLRGHQVGEWSVAFGAEGQRVKARLCAVRKTVAAAEDAKAKMLRAARKKGRRLLPQTIEAAEYIVVLTTLDRHTSASEVLELYRARWQVELAFKRLKSLLQGGHVPKSHPESARAWIQAKLLTVLLIERLIEEAGFFSPWGCELPAAQHLA